MRPVDAVLAVTFRCNARCRMCGIWKSDPGSEMPPGAYRKLPDSLRDINLTGGEPFMREDLAAIHAAAKEACPRARTIVSTNGLMTDRIISCVGEMAKREPKIGIAVSVDGPAEVHNRVRGVPNAFDRAMTTIAALKREGFDNLRLAFTATRENLQHLQTVYEMSRELGVQFSCAIEHGSEHYFQSPAPEASLPANEVRRQLAPVMSAELHSLSPKRWARAYFMQCLAEFSSKRARPLPCYAGRYFFFMDPRGDVYACNVEPLLMGDLAEDDFDAIWASDKAEDARRRASRCDKCWMICTARTAVKRAWPRVLAWAFVRRVMGVPTAGEPR